MDVFLQFYIDGDWLAVYKRIKDRNRPIYLHK